MNNNKKITATLLLAVSMVIYGSIGLFVKSIPLPSAAIAAFRGISGALFLFLFKLIRGKGIDFKALGKKLPVLIISGGVMGVNWVLLFEAYNYTSVAVGTMCYYLAPMIAIIAAVFVLKEKFTLKKAVCILAAFAGMFLISGLYEGFGSGDKNFIGVLLALGASVLYASVIIMNKFLGDIETFDKTIIQLISSAVVTLPYSLIVEKPTFDAMDVKAVIMLLTIGLVHTGIAYALFFGTINLLPTQTVAIFSYIDPMTAVLFSALLLKEPIGAVGIIGAVLIIAASLFNELKIGDRSH